MAVTPIYNLPFPILSDPPNGPAQIGALAQAVENELNRIDTAILPTIIYTSNVNTIVNPTLNAVAYDTTRRTFYRYTGAVWASILTIGGRVVSQAGFITTGIDDTPEVNITKLALENTQVVGGTFYVLNLYLSVNFATVAANDSYLVRVRKDTPLVGTVILEGNLRPASPDLFDDSKTLSQPWLAPATDTDADFYVSIQRVFGTGTMNVYGNSRTSFWIDEKSADTGIWSVVP